MFPVWKRLLLFCCFCCRTANSFPPNNVQSEPNTQSHFSITLGAVYASTASFLDMFNLINNTGQSYSQKVQEYFGSDQESYSNHIGIIRRIIGYENNIQRDYAGISFYHVNGEQIEIAHNYIRTLRQSIADLSSTATSEDDLEEIREKVGAALYTIQEFYSNTNWIELTERMRNNKIYEDFGQDNVTLVAIAGEQDNTCADCGLIEGLLICDNNIRGDKLTSGYKSGQDVTKPIRTGFLGKCSHGSPDDDSRFSTATGGIYKGRSIVDEAPHSSRHGSASDAAMNATEYFLIGQGRGLLSLIGAEAYRDVFGLRTREDVVKTSLTFVIDVTGSMGDDIKAVIAATKNIVNEAKDSDFVPENYILVTFSDPESLTTGRKTTNPQTMITWLEDLVVSGGGDCAEYALSGMLKGIEMSNVKSKIYLCTDADAKDEDKQGEVMAGLMAKQLTPVFLLTGQCSRRRRKRNSDGAEEFELQESFSNKKDSRGQRVKRSSLQVFQKIAEGTGGLVYETKVAELEAIVEKEIKDTFPSSNVFVTHLIFPINYMPNKNISIPVDNHIETLKIEITTVSADSEFSLLYPNGTDVMFSSNIEQKNILGGKLTISILNPSTGAWILTRKTSKAWTVNVTAQSPMDFSTSLLAPSPDGNSYFLVGNPIMGFNYSIVVDIQNANHEFTCDYALLFDDNWSEVAEIPLTKMAVQGISSCIGPFVPFNKSSFIQINGTDELGNPYLRTRMFSILPTSVQLRVLPVLGALRLNEGTNISFSLTNTGDSTAEFIITISDGDTTIDVQTGILKTGQIYEAVVMVTPDSLKSVVLRFAVSLKNYTGVVQSETRRFSVTDTRTADCTVLEYPKTCPVESLNSYNCSKYIWTGLVEVSSSTIRLSEIIVSSEEVVLEHMNLTLANFSLPISVRGSCCVQAVLISILDKNGHFSQCRFELSNQPLAIVQPTTPAVVEPKTEVVVVSWLMIGVVVGSVVAGIILVALLAVLIYKTKFNKNNSGTAVSYTKEKL